MTRLRAVSAVLLFAVLGRGVETHAQTTEIGAFAGYGFGGSLPSPAAVRDIPIEGGLTYGAVFSKAIATTWRVEVLFSRQESRVADVRPGTHIDAAIERYMAGIQEEAGPGNARAFGTCLIGATRFVPAGFDSETWFTIALGLGVKTRLAQHVGLRVEARGFYTPVTGYGATVCSSGRCIFEYSGSGMFQGDLSGGVFFAF
jgi:hypothetical protein